MDKIEKLIRKHLRVIVFEQSSGYEIDEAKVDKEIQEVMVRAGGIDIEQENLRILERAKDIKRGIWQSPLPMLLSKGFFMAPNDLAFYFAMCLARRFTTPLYQAEPSGSFINFVVPDSALVMLLQETIDNYSPSWVKKTIN